MIIYPIFGSWAWGGLLDGGGWLENLGFLDFAGSTVVHSIGGWLALAGAIVLGPRIGGALVVLSVLFIDNVLKVDDPVGAVSVHGVCGLWGTLSCGLFNMDSGLFYGGGVKQLDDGELLVFICESNGHLQSLALG